MLTPEEMASLRADGAQTLEWARAVDRRWELEREAGRAPPAGGDGEKPHARDAATSADRAQGPR